MPDTELLSPVSSVPGDGTKPVEDGIAVCLSGGGYRAMHFYGAMRGAGSSRRNSISRLRSAVFSRHRSIQFDSPEGLH